MFVFKKNHLLINLPPKIQLLITLANNSNVHNSNSIHFVILLAP